MMSMWWRLSLLGLIGTASMLLAPLEQLVPADMPPLAIRLAATIQPAILVVAAAALGAWAAPRVGLDSPAVRAWSERRTFLPVLGQQFPAALLAGLAVAAVLLAYLALIRPTEEGALLMRITMPIATRVLYGGIAEELLFRWGVMSLLVWLAWQAAGRPHPVTRWAYWTGIAGAALLFAVGHLPALHLLLPQPPSWLLALVVGANFVPGLVFGWLFYRRGLEAAILAHSLAHLFSWAALTIL